MPAEGSWGAEREMVEDLSIGTLDGAEERTFTWIGGIAVDPDGGIYVFDWQLPALRYFDSEGRYVRTLGREGSGPGEYGGWSEMFFQLHQLPGQQRELAAFTGALSLRGDGTLLLADLAHARLNVYGPDGTLAEQWPLRGGMYSRQGIAVDTAGHVYVSIATQPIVPTAAVEVAYAHFDAAGNAVDTIPVPTIDGEPRDRPLGPTDPVKVHVVTPLGHMVVGVNDEYTFEVHRPGEPPVSIERVHEPVSFHPDERAEWQAVADWLRRHDHPGQIRDVQDRKLAYRSFLADQQGRVWVRLHVEAQKDESIEVTSRERGGPPLVSWVEPAVYDVFEPDGTYLGRVRFPWRTVPIVIRGDTAWGVRRGDVGEQYMVRLVMR
jgi:hypothetical protein